MRSASPPGAALKAMPVIVEGRGMVLALVRGDHRLNEIKLANALGAGFRQATAEEIEAELGPPGFIGPVGAEVPVIKDAAIQGGGYFAGANRPDTHLIGVEPGPRLRVRGARLPHGRGRRPLAVAATRSRSRPRSRSATSSSSAPATPSRSAPPTSTPTARSTRS